MTTNLFQEIDSIHSQWSNMNKTTRLAWLMGERCRLDGLVYKFAQYFIVKGGILNDDERAYAYKLLEMTQDVDVKGSNLVNELANETLKNIFKGIIR